MLASTCTKLCVLSINSGKLTFGNSKNLKLFTFYSEDQNIDRKVNVNYADFSVELDMTDVTNVRCRMYTSDDESSLPCSDEHISKLMHR